MLKNFYKKCLVMRYVPFPLMENEPKRSRPELSARDSGHPTAPRSSCQEILDN